MSSYFGSGEKKVVTNNSQVGASENAQLANLGGRIFNVGGKGNPTASDQKTNWTPILVGVVVVVLIISVFRRN